MRPATAVGTDLNGDRVEQDQPYRALVESAWVTLGRWPSSPRALRGSVVSALGPGAHVDLHGHLGDGTTRQARATVAYRVHDGRASVWAYGPRAVDHVLEIARIRHLRCPAGDLVAVGDGDLGRTTTAVGLLKDRWRRYELVTPYWPSAVAYARRPRRAHERVAWAGQAMASSIRLWLADVGVVTHEHRPVHVHVVDLAERIVTWRDEPQRHGFVARVVSNAILPDGIGIGQHISEGWGELRCVTS